MGEWFNFADVARIVAGGVALLFFVAIVKIINSNHNDLEWADLFSTVSVVDKKQHADWDKIGKGCGVMLCVWMPVVYSYSPKMDATGLALLLGVVLLYLGGVSAYSATLRSRQGSVLTTTLNEPAGDPSGRKETRAVLETAPILVKE